MFKEPNPGVVSRAFISGDKPCGARERHIYGHFPVSSVASLFIVQPSFFVSHLALLLSLVALTSTPLETEVSLDHRLRPLPVFDRSRVLRR